MEGLLPMQLMPLAAVESVDAQVELRHDKSIRMTRMIVFHRVSPFLCTRQPL
jgi:hypothetical protein